MRREATRPVTVQDSLPDSIPTQTLNNQTSNLNSGVTIALPVLS